MAIVIGTGNSETIDGADGVTNGMDTVWGLGGDDWIYGLGGADTLHGGNGDDRLFGGSGADTLNGGNNNDYLVGGTGGDTLNGGDGIDQASYSGSSSGVIVSLLTGYTSGGDAAGDTLISIDNVTGSGFADLLIGDNNDNVLQGLNDNDTLKGYGGQDILNGGDGEDWLYGMDGNDTLWGSDGNDKLYGGADNDTYYVDGAGDVVIEAAGEGTDLVNTSVNYTLTANVENLTTSATGWADLLLTGNALDNQITGNNGDNTLNGGGGLDTMIGNSGDDTYVVDTEDDVAIEAAGEGHDVVLSYSDYVLSDNIEELSLNVGSASSAIGNGMNNVLYGNAFDNFLNGGDGADQLSGLGGNDTFVFQIDQAQGDTVYEFEGNGGAAGDLLYFVGYGTAAEGATFTQQTATDWLITSADGLTVETITLSGAPSVDASDFVFV